MPKSKRSRDLGMKRGKRLRNSQVIGTNGPSEELIMIRYVPESLKKQPMEFSVSMRAAPQVPSAAPPNLRIVFDG